MVGCLVSFLGCLFTAVDAVRLWLLFFVFVDCLVNDLFNSVVIFI